MFAVAMCAASLFAAPQQNFATDVEAYLAAHKIAGVESFQGLLKLMGEPCGAAALDGEWKSVEGATAAEKAAMRFFKVVVELP